MVVDRQPVLDDFQVGMVEARIDEPAGTHALGRGLAAGDDVEEIRTFLGAAKAKVEVRNTGGLTAPSDSEGS